MLTTLPPSCAVIMKYGNLNFLEPSGSLQARNGTALPSLLPEIKRHKFSFVNLLLSNVWNLIHVSYVRSLSKLDSALYLGGVLFESRVEIFEFIAICKGFSMLISF
jgi:hypothetical protein